LAQTLLASLEEISREFQIVLSRGEPNGPSKPTYKNEVKVYDWIENQDDYIRASDIIVSRAGHGTIMKALLYGKPMILIPIPDHTEQTGNARRATYLHVAKIIDQSALNGRTLKSAIQDILRSNEYRKKAVEFSQEASSMRAIPTACDAIEKLGRKLKPHFPD
jgi:uncharacterized protein (TIGR00661 family)